MAKKQTESEEIKTTLEDFILPQKIKAFVSTYKPAVESTASDIFTDSRLREFFKAYVCTLGDPLAVYLEQLEQHGFQLSVTISGEPALFVVRTCL